MPGISFKFYDAGCADAISVRFNGNDGLKHNLWIDSGYEESYDLLRPEFEEIAFRTESISLWVITHWDDDHIGGIIKYLEDEVIRQQVPIQRIWFNANYRALRSRGKTEGFVGVKKGVLLRDVIQDELGITVPIITTETQPINLFGMKLSILSPVPEVYLEAISNIQAYSPTGSKTWDYSETIEALSKKDSPPDRRLENRSSIAFLIEYGWHRFLMLADASPVDVVCQLRKLGYSETNPLKVDFIKVAHHGSKRNISKEFLSLIDTEKFVFTADGSEQHKLPDKETIAHILCHPKREFSNHISLFFNHQSKQLEGLFEADGADVFERLNFSMHFPEQGQKDLIIQLP